MLLESFAYSPAKLRYVVNSVFGKRGSGWFPMRRDWGVCGCGITCLPQKFMLAKINALVVSVPTVLARLLIARAGIVVRLQRGSLEGRDEIS